MGGSVRCIRLQNKCSRRHHNYRARQPPDHCSSCSLDAIAALVSWRVSLRAVMVQVDCRLPLERFRRAKHAEFRFRRMGISDL
jgi:hypothetical protein